jgi:hypothetical protein
VDREFAGSLDEVEVVIERGDDSHGWGGPRGEGSRIAHLLRRKNGSTAL